MSNKNKEILNKNDACNHANTNQKSTKIIILQNKNNNNKKIRFGSINPRPNNSSLVPNLLSKLSKNKNVKVYGSNNTNNNSNGTSIASLVFNNSIHNNNSNTSDNDNSNDVNKIESQSSDDLGTTPIISSLNTHIIHSTPDITGLSLNKASSLSPCLSPAFALNHSPNLSSHGYNFPSPIHPNRFNKNSSNNNIITQLRLNNNNSTSYSPSFSFNKSISSNNTDKHVSFSELKVVEFSLTSGTESDGVPEYGGHSLALGKKLRQSKVNIDEYEKKRYLRLKKRALQTIDDVSENDIELNAQKYLYTRGRNDDFYHSLTEEERVQKLKDYNAKRENQKNTKKEAKLLNELRKSRERNEIYCTCKPLNRMPITGLKYLASKYKIKYNNKRVKKADLLKKILRYLNKNNSNSDSIIDGNYCCFDKKLCSCLKNGINCHSGNNCANERCGCCKAKTNSCNNPNGRYVYETPLYDENIIKEWKNIFENNSNDSVVTPKVTFTI